MKSEQQIREEIVYMESWENLSEEGKGFVKALKWVLNGKQED